MVYIIILFIYLFRRRGGIVEVEILVHLFEDQALGWG